MIDSEMKYNGEFTIEERKAMTAKTLKELRKANKLSQKEVAAKLKIPATTYNTYESGRTEPPIEILVRLSHIYQVPVDLIIQRDRTYNTADDALKVITAYREQVAELERQIIEGGQNNPAISDLLDAMGKLTDAMTAFSQTETAKKLDIPKQD